MGILTLRNTCLKLQQIKAFRALFLPFETEPKIDLQSLFPKIGTKMGIFIQAEILIHKNVLNFRWNFIDFFVWQIPSWFCSEFMDEMQLRQNSGFSRTTKMFSLLLVLFPCSHDDGY